MFGFASKYKKREDVQRILLARTNRVQLRTISGNNSRGGTRATLTEVVWVLPCASYANADYARVFAAVTKDLSANGMSFVCEAQVTGPRVIVGLKQETDERRFLLCTLKHCTPLEDGFYHVGLLADEVIQVDASDEDTMRRAIEQHSQAGRQETAGSVRIVG